jgi:hypothetical protein
MAVIYGSRWPNTGGPTTTDTVAPGLGHRVVVPAAGGVLGLAAAGTALEDLGTAVPGPGADLSLVISPVTSLAADQSLAISPGKNLVLRVEADPSRNQHLQSHGAVLNLSLGAAAMATRILV